MADLWWVETDGGVDLTAGFPPSADRLTCLPPGGSLLRLLREDQRYFGLGLQLVTWWRPLADPLAYVDYKSLRLHFGHACRRRANGGTDAWYYYSQPVWDPPGTTLAGGPGTFGLVYDPNLVLADPPQPTPFFLTQLGLDTLRLTIRDDGVVVGADGGVDVASMTIDSALWDDYELYHGIAGVNLVALWSDQQGVASTSPAMIGGLASEFGGSTVSWGGEALDAPGVETSLEPVVTPAAGDHRWREPPRFYCQASGAMRYLAAVLAERYTGRRTWQVPPYVLEPGSLVRLSCGAEVLTRNRKVRRRPRALVAWTTSLETTDDVALLLAVPETDRVALLDAVAMTSDDLGATFAEGLPEGVPAAVADWPAASASLVVADRGGDATVIGLGVRDDDGDAVIFAVGLAASGGVPLEVTVATVAAAEVASGPVSPVLWREPSGVWHVGVYLYYRWREWRSTNSDGSAWTAVANEVLTQPQARRNTVILQRLDGSQVIAGVDESDHVEVNWRPRPSDSWSTVPGGRWATPGQVAPYLVEAETGEIEVGWLVGEALTHYAAAHVDGDWSAL